MNKLFQVILLLIFIIFLSTLSLHVKGDVDLNGKVELHDMLLIKRNILGYDDNLSLYQLYLSDMNNDKKISNIDIEEIKNILLK